MKVAVPVKGRLREPSFHLFEDAGLGPEQPGDRALAFPCRNAPVEVLLVRASDVPEYVQDGVVVAALEPNGALAEHVHGRNHLDRLLEPHVRMLAC